METLLRATPHFVFMLTHASLRNLTLASKEIFKLIAPAISS
jgi:hypothetical protein